MTAATREERAELEALREEADRAAADAARTLAELAGRLSPRAAVARSKTLKIAAVVLLVAAGSVAAVGITRVIGGSRRP